MSRELSALYRSEEIQCKNYNELVGICKGIIADGKVCAKEAEFLHNWISRHAELVDCFPGNILADRLASMLADGRLDDEEAAELMGTLQNLTGEKGQQGKGDVTTALGFDNPMPEITVVGQLFCLTGTFASGERKSIIRQLEALGAEIAGSVPKKHPCCLVVGSLVTAAWKYSTHGRKLEAAVALRNDGYPVAIISEDHLWNEIERLGMLA